jgi:hypothetical protein
MYSRYAGLRTCRFSLQDSQGSGGWPSVSRLFGSQFSRRQPEAAEEIVAVEERDDETTVVLKKVPCGKDNCNNCPHDPYRDLVTRDGDSVSWDYRSTAEVTDLSPSVVAEIKSFCERH